MLCSFRLVQEEKTFEEIPGSSRLEFSEKGFANRFTLSNAEGNTSGPLNRGGIADLPFLRTLSYLRTLPLLSTLAIRRRSREPSFWEVIDSFGLLT